MKTLLSIIDKMARERAVAEILSSQRPLFNLIKEDHFTALIEQIKKVGILSFVEAYGIKDFWIGEEESKHFRL